MKTSQLAATVSSRFFYRGHVIAVERDESRCETLKTMLAKSGADNFVRVIKDDFLKLDPKDFDDVEYILLDPTCSGSGMKVCNFTNRLNGAKKFRRLAIFFYKIVNETLGKGLIYLTWRVGGNT
jgi:16S rRNA C967 or C1407 C5-methylase (RsmB/RsmF family)